MIDPSYYVAAFFILGAFSLVWRDNPWFRFTEHTVIATVLAHSLVSGVDSLQKTGIKSLMAGDWSLLIPMLLGMIVFARLIKGGAWITNLVIAITIGVGTGLFIRGYMTSSIMGQITPSLSWALTKYDPLNWANGFITAVFALFTVMAFTFTREHTGIFGASAKVGRILIMLAMGINAASLGNWYFQYGTTRIEQLLATFGIIPML